MTNHDTVDAFIQALEPYYQDAQSYSGAKTRAAWLATYLFDVDTYDDDMGEWFTDIMLATARAVSERATFEFIKDRTRYRDYLTAVNLPFFVGRLEWGGSIRGAWWTGDQTLEVGDESITVDDAGAVELFKALTTWAELDDVASEVVAVA